MLVLACAMRMEGSDNMEQTYRPKPGAIRVYTDHDPAIRVELTGSGTQQCFRLVLGDAKILLHTRSAVDLSQKLQKAILSWIGEAVSRASSSAPLTPE